MDTMRIVLLVIFCCFLSTTESKISDRFKIEIPQDTVTILSLKRGNNKTVIIIVNDTIKHIENGKVMRAEHVKDTNIEALMKPKSNPASTPPDKKGIEKNRDTNSNAENDLNGDNYTLNFTYWNDGTIREVSIERDTI